MIAGATPLQDALEKIDRGSLPVALVDVQDGADIRMVQRGRQSRFPFESSEGIDVLRQRRLQELDRDGPRQAGLLRFVDDAHAAAAERADDVEVRDPPADHIPLSKCANRLSWADTFSPTSRSTIMSSGGHHPPDISLDST